MNNNRNSRFGSRKESGRKSFGRKTSLPGMHKTTCDECKRICEVPFRPTGNKPVLCNICFKGKESSAVNKYDIFDKKQYEAPGCNDELLKIQFEQLNNKMDLIIKTLVSISAQLTVSEKGKEKEDPGKNKKTVVRKKTVTDTKKKSETSAKEDEKSS
ncbi:MAG: hypothetical protein GY730_05505 [bacterium]|nr:hypothetical protein [bacterium]